jgi:hypothetical protein
MMMTPVKFFRHCEGDVLSPEAISCIVSEIALSGFALLAMTIN